MKLGLFKWTGFIWRCKTVLLGCGSLCVCFSSYSLCNGRTSKTWPLPLVFVNSGVRALVSDLTAPVVATYVRVFIQHLLTAILSKSIIIVSKTT